MKLTREDIGSKFILDGNQTVKLLKHGATQQFCFVKTAEGENLEVSQERLALINSELVINEVLRKALGIRNIDDVKQLRSYISQQNLDDELCPIARVLDAIIEGNSDLVEILSPEVRIVADVFIEMIRKNFDFNLILNGKQKE